MRRLARVLLVCVIIGNNFVGYRPALAQAIAPVVIRTVQTADQHTENGKLVTKSDDELVELENPGQASIDITGWKLQYLTASNTYTMLTFTADMTGGHVFLPAQTREVVFSTSYIANHPTSTTDKVIDYKAAFHFSQNLSATSGGVQLTNGVSVVDAVKWGTVDTLIAPLATNVLRRVTYTGNMKADFTSVPQDSEAYSFGNTYSQADICLNITGYQAEMPDGYGLDVSGSCVSLDVCPNLDGIQTDIPLGLELYGGVCQAVFVPAPLHLTELLANPSGIDKGNEFIELYNPTRTPVALTDYYLLVGAKRVAFPAESVIPADSYLALSDLQLGVVFPNTSGKTVTLLSRNDIELDTMPAYQNADIDMAWAVIDGSWQYTNRPTPSTINLSSQDEDTTSGASSTLVACKPNQYRSEETGRCRNYATLMTPTPCKDGQYRSEETGRCRSIAQTVSAELKPCSDDQFRNPATGRCKKIASTEDILEPCQAGWERNPATNRCRKVSSSTMPLADYPVTPTSLSPQTAATWWAVGGIAAVALAYAGWEWRREIATGLHRLKILKR